MADNIFNILANENRAIEPIHRIFDGDPIDSSVRLSKRMANIESDLSKEFNAEVLGVVIRVYTPSPDSPPKTSVNQTIKRLTNQPAFYEYEVIDKNSPVGFSSISNASSLDVFKSLSGCTKICSTTLSEVMQTGCIVKIKYSTNNSREGIITEIIDRSPKIKEELTSTPSFEAGRPMPVVNLIKKICDEKTKFLAEPDSSNKGGTASVDQRKQKRVKFFSNLNCDLKGAFKETANPDKVSTYFTLEDLTVSDEFGRNLGIKNEPTELHKKHLEAFSKNCLDKIVDHLKKNYPELPDSLRAGIKFKFSSVYRNPTINAVAGIRNDSSSNSEELVSDKWLDKFQKQVSTQVLIGHNGGTAADLLFPITSSAFQKGGKSGIVLLCDIAEDLFKNNKDLNINLVLIESYGPGSVWIHIEYYLPQSGLIKSTSFSDKRGSILMWGPKLTGGGDNYARYDRNQIIQYVQAPTPSQSSNPPQTSLVR